MPGHRGARAAGRAAARAWTSESPDCGPTRGRTGAPDLLAGCSCRLGPGARAEPDDGRFRQHAGLHREDHPRPARRLIGLGPTTPRSRSPRHRTRRLDARRATRGRGRVEVGRAAGGRDEHEPGTRRRHRHGRPGGPGRTARRRRAVLAACRAVGAPARRTLATDSCSPRRPPSWPARSSRPSGRAKGRVRAAPKVVERAPLDVLCQQLIGMACEGEWSNDGFPPFLALVRRAGARWRDLTRGDCRRLPRFPGRRPPCRRPARPSRTRRRGC